MSTGNRRSQIVMTGAESDSLLAECRTITVASLGPDGQPHLVAMWFVVVDGDVWFQTKAKSQKVVNLRRDDRITVLAEAGNGYDELRGVEIEGTAEVVADAARLWQVGVAIFERYYEPWTEAARPILEDMLRNRVAVRVLPRRTRSWDHRKLG